MKTFQRAFLYLTCFLLSVWQFPCYAESETNDEPSIQNPGPEMANFPNSAFTLPQGRAYLEAAFNYNSRTRNDDPAQFSIGYFLRYGLVDDLEIRVVSNGYTWIDDEDKTNGMSPQVLDVKWHVLDEQQDSYLPALGVEFSVQTDWASKVFKSSWLPALSLNFDQTLPFDIALGYNIGFVSQKNEEGKTQYQLALSWALQREIVEELAAFVNGYTNTGNGLTTSAVGAGLQWTQHKRVALFTNLSAGLTRTTPKFSALVGFAVAF